MGALSCIRKKVDECFNVNNRSSSFSSIGSSMYLDSIDCQVFKKQKSSLSPMHQSPTDKVASSRNSVVSRLSRYPKPEQPLKREPLGPTRRKFGFTWKTEFREDKGRTVEVGERGDMGNALSAKYRETKASAYEALCYAKESLGREDKGKEKVVSEDSSIEEGWCVLDGLEGEFGDSGRLLSKNDGLSGIVWKMEGEAATAEKTIPVSSSKVSDQTEDHTEVEDTQIMIRSWSLSKENVAERPQYRKLHKDATKRDPKLQHLGFQIDLILKNILLRGPVKEPKQEDSSLEPFVPLTPEEEDEVEHAFKANRKKVLVSHDDSNIQITREVLQCLRPGAWLNDEVINLYLELLKEREKREPNKFLKCHFFNTFFYKKLMGGKKNYDYKSVRRWTSQKKLGYSLNECEKIFVPVHQQVHWCLAVINMKDQKFQYLDSLGGRDPHVLNLLAKYYVDELKDKNALDINVSSWKHEYVKDLPGQENGSDCGVFMIKYIDFYSRGLMLQFSQEDMPYFRRRMAKEILRLRAD